MFPLPICGTISTLNKWWFFFFSQALHMFAFTTNWYISKNNQIARIQGTQLLKKRKEGLNSNFMMIRQGYFKRFEHKVSFVYGKVLPNSPSFSLKHVSLIRYMVNKKLHRIYCGGRRRNIIKSLFIYVFL